MVAVGEFEILLTVLFFLAGGFATWLWRHEVWFRNRIFPVIQVLTGKGPGGTDPDPTYDGHLQESQNRIEHVEDLAEEAAEVADESLAVAKQTRDDVQDLTESVEDLADTQDQHAEEVEDILQRILIQTEGVEPADADLFSYREENADD